MVLPYNKLLMGCANYTNVETDPYFSSVRLLIHGQNNIQDSSGDARTLTLHGSIATTSSSPIYGTTSIGFDGINDRITLSTLTVSDVFTIEGWLWPNSYGLTIMSSTITAGNAYQIKTISSYPGLFLAFLETSTGILEIATSQNVITLNQWNFWQLISDGSTVKVYINGVQKFSANVTGASFVLREIGAGNNASFFDGKMAEIRISEVARTPGIPSGPFPDS